MTSQWFNQSILQLKHALESQHVNLETIVDAFYQRITDREPHVQAWQYLMPQHEYLQRYHAHQHFYQNSPLKGLPFAIKDVIDTAGIKTCMGSKIHANRIPTMDAAVVTAIKQAGGIILGKTVTTEFAFFKPGKTRNPHDAHRTPGGSSSGSAAAVADFMAPFALGTQTAASVIRPASYCGCLAYVAGHNEFSLRNIQPLAQSLDSLGMFAHHFADIAMMRQILQLNRVTPFMAAASNLKIAVCNGQQWGEIEADMQQAFLAYQNKLQQHFQCVEIPESLNLAALEQHHMQIMAYEVARNLQFEYQTGMLDALLTELIEHGLKLSYRQYVQHLSQAKQIKQDYCQWMQQQQIDVSIAPAATGVAPLGLQRTGQPLMSRPWQVMGLPVTTFPMAYQHKLPLGIQVIGLPQQDDKLLSISQYLYDLFDQY